MLHAADLGAIGERLAQTQLGYFFEAANRDSGFLP